MKRNTIEKSFHAVNYAASAALCCIVHSSSFAPPHGDEAGQDALDQQLRVTYQTSSASSERTATAEPS